jgi:chromosome segregation ATPase
VRIQALNAEVEAARNRSEVLEGTSRSKSSRVEELEKELENVTGVYEEKLLYMQMQLNVSKGRDEARDKELASLKKRADGLNERNTFVEAALLTHETKDAENKKQIDTLQRRVAELEPELKRSLKLVSEFERHSGAAVMMKAEQDSIVSGLRKDLRAALETREALTRRVSELEAGQAKAEVSLSQLAATTEQVSALQASLDEKNAILKRLTTDAQANSAQHAIRTGKAY